jgi:uncharacterized membrane protein
VEKPRLSRLSATLIIVIAILAVVGTVLSAFFNASASNFLATVDNVTVTLLTMVTYALSLFGGAVMLFGAVLIMIRFAQTKLRDSNKPSGVTKHLSGYLTLSLELFIGAEIVKATITRTFTDFSVLILIILSRGLFSLILYLERRWHGSETETE